MRICPAGAIKPKPLEIGSIELGNSGGVDFVGGKLKLGSVRTPALMKEVKKHTRKDCLAIIDVPPGTSCPVVEAVRDADFVLLVAEPTPFGLNDLKLAVSLVRHLNLPFAVVINRCDIGNEDLEGYCKAECIDILARLPEDRRVAEVYSSGKMIVDELPEYRNHFYGLSVALKARV